MVPTNDTERWAEVLTDHQRACLRQLTREADNLEATVRAFSIRVYEALQPFMEVRHLVPAGEAEDRFYAWSCAEPLMGTMTRIAAHATAAALEYPSEPVDWFDKEAHMVSEFAGVYRGRE